MQVSVEKTSELNRKMTVTLPEEMLKEKMQARFKSLAREIKIDGFRPGKVPMTVVKKMYSDKVRNEITGDLIQKTYVEALKEQDLNPAGYPHIKETKQTSGFEYIAEFEVYPEISLDKLSSLEIKRPLAIVEQADQDVMIEKLRQQNKTWNVVERASQEGDRVTINFSGVCDGENFTDGTVEDFQLEIGAKQMISKFEDELIGLEAGENKSFEATFPDDYQNTNLAGKTGVFEAELIKVEEAVIPEIDEEFAKTFGIEDGTLDSFYDAVKGNMERQLDQGLKARLKNSVMESIFENMQIAVPNALVDQEIEQMQKSYKENAKKQNMNDVDLPRELFEEKAKRNVKLGLILGAVIQSNDIKVDAEKVRSAIVNLATTYENPDEVIEMYASDEKNLNQVKQMVLEEQAIDWVISQAQVTDENINFSDVMDNKHGMVEG